MSLYKANSSGNEKMMNQFSILLKREVESVQQLSIFDFLENDGHEQQECFFYTVGAMYELTSF